MSSSPARWTAEKLVQDAATAAAQFRAERLAVSDWELHYSQARRKFERLFEKLGDLDPAAINDDKLAQAFASGLGEALRYLAGPPISADDLKVIADVESITPGALKKNPDALRKVFGVIERLMDSHRFPWMGVGERPTGQQREAALLAHSRALSTRA